MKEGVTAFLFLLYSTIETKTNSTMKEHVCKNPQCLKMVNPKETKRIFGEESAVHTGGFCSAACYTSYVNSDKNKVIHSIGNPTVEVNENKERVVITTMLGNKFEVVISKNCLQVTCISTPGAGIVVNPMSHCSILLKEKE